MRLFLLDLVRCLAPLSLSLTIAACGAAPTDTAAGGTAGGGGGSSSSGAGDAGGGGDAGAPAATTAVTAFAPSTDHSCAILTSGALECWGDNQFGQLGNGSQSKTPGPVGAAGDKWLAVSTGFRFTCAIKAPGEMWCWGDNDTDQLGAKTTDKKSLSPVRMGTASDWVAIASGLDASCGIHASGKAECWGVMTPSDHVDLPGTWVHLAQGPLTDQFCAVATPSDSGTIYCWNSIKPTSVKKDGSADGHAFSASDPSSWTMVAVAVQGVDQSASTVCAVRSNGALYCVGSNGKGQVGIGTFGSTLTMKQVGNALTWTSVAVEDGTTCGTQSDGSLWCWGDVSSWVGNGTRLSNIPVKVRGGGIRSVFANGDGFGLFGVKTDATLWSLEGTESDALDAPVTPG